MSIQHRKVIRVGWAALPLFSDLLCPITPLNYLNRHIKMPVHYAVMGAGAGIRCGDGHQQQIGDGERLA